MPLIIRRVRPKSSCDARQAFHPHPFPSPLPPGQRPFRAGGKGEGLLIFPYVPEQFFIKLLTKSFP
jgi:hypothetical protein